MPPGSFSRTHAQQTSRTGVNAPVDEFATLSTSCAARVDSFLLSGARSHIPGGLSSKVVMRRTVRSVSVGRKLRRQKHWALMLSSALAASAARTASAASAHEASRQLAQESSGGAQDSRVLPFNIP